MGRVVLVRLAAIAAIVVSAFLTADLANPGRGFCPLHEACEKARESALGTLYGVPTSVWGMVAFGGLFVLTLLPSDKSRRFMLPAGFLSLVGGLLLVAYQAYWLRSFCPLCLVADGAGIVAGALALSWPRPPPYCWRGWLPGESGSARVVWTVLALFAVLVPMNWPRPAEKGWVEILPVVEFEEHWFPEFPLAAAPGGGSAMAQAQDTAHPAPAPTPVDATPAPFPPSDVLAVPSPFSMQGETGAPDAAPETQAETVVASAPPEPVDDAPAPADAKDEPKPLLVIEYVNAYCPHCRATHGRLERVAQDMGVSVRWRRVYVWRGRDAPLWARACAFAQAVGLEDRFFQELIQTRNNDRGEIYAAARRAGLDLAELKRAVRDTAVPKRLVRDRRIAQMTRINRLPTIDVGRRRLLGEQSESELRVALQFAVTRRGNTGTP